MKLAMSTLEKRLASIEKLLKSRRGGTFTVHYKDGSRKRIRPDEAVIMIHNEPDKIDHFEDNQDGAGNGFLAKLINDLLVP